MKLISGIYNDQQLNKYLDYIDGAILMVPHFSLVYGDLDLDKAIDKLQKRDKTIIISLNKIFLENEKRTDSPGRGQRIRQEPPGGRLCGPFRRQVHLLPGFIRQLRRPQLLYAAALEPVHPGMGSAYCG